MDISIKRCISPFLQTNMYVVSNNGHCIIIDPGCVLNNEAIGNNVVDMIILTHEHIDHICGANLYRERYNCRVIANEVAAVGMMDPKVNMSHYGQAVFELICPSVESFESMHIDEDYVCEVDSTISDDEVIDWGDIEIQAIYTPGHSPGSMCLNFNNEYLFCGDTLFKDIPIGLRFRGSSKKDYEEITLPKLKKLGKEIHIFPGHGEDFFLYECSSLGKTQ